MLGLHVRTLPGEDFLVCKTRKMDVWDFWWLKGYGFEKFTFLNGINMLIFH